MLRAGFNVVIDKGKGLILQQVVEVSVEVGSQRAKASRMIWRG